MNQYDFTGTSSQIATGVYAVVDSDGNIIANDLAPEDIQHCLEVLNGDSNICEDSKED